MQSEKPAGVPEGGGGAPAARTGLQTGGQRTGGESGYRIS